ncbi:bifunctional 5,10-methylenetetrahydrofolate dehydrogenase/5,10-methenyltetrahydrofolate cyclohydrolase [Limosilactobacillus secaliphilus]|uniref:Bifunctional protein FolD n=1 Tax=Limosilactobacillus secaliphilus TaxID=396268 RepID=A0A0R2I2U5_9LACO|nr:tetrahydrofolate dehydrogenase/cyclohydrolase catalytic domain-containing protein [Limosilactobacillus secaliphilus]KRN59118.1 methylenetetrahydrofolate dehydrogenase methenyltetrahydrofolate cyclohydrolase [Limosilactobacillus secaliphilus]
MATIIDGRNSAAELNATTARRVAQLKKKGIVPGIAVILVGDDPASVIYTRNKDRKAKKLGIRSILKRFPADARQAEVLATIQEFNNDDRINAILVQSPLPSQLDETTLVQAIDPAKDVDGFHPVNVGKLYGNEEGNYPIPCTPRGIMTMLSKYQVPIAGSNAVIIGRSNLVGKPMLSLLTNANATVTMLNHLTPNPQYYTQNADLLIVGVGQPNFIHAADVKKGATVIDVGINRNSSGHLVGDVDFEDVQKVAAKITPVPGGVGPMTIASLMEQTVDLAEWSE